MSANKDTTAADAVDRVARAVGTPRTVPSQPPAQSPVPTAVSMADIVQSEVASAMLGVEKRLSEELAAVTQAAANERKAHLRESARVVELEQALAARDDKFQALAKMVDELERAGAEEGALLRVLATQVTDLHHRANRVAEAVQAVQAPQAPQVRPARKAGAVPLLQLWF